MKRRALLVRTLTTTMSASLFTAVGWLMGTRTLTMTIVASPFPACCNGGVTYQGPPLSGPFCVNAVQPCPPGGGQGAWGQCAYDCYRYYCTSDLNTWCYTYCLDVVGLCCWYTDCPLQP